MATRRVGLGSTLGTKSRSARAVWLGCGLLFLAACGRTEQSTPDGTGGDTATEGEGGSNTGGSNTGGSNTGGSNIGGIPPCSTTPPGCGSGGSAAIGSGGIVGSAGAATAGGRPNTGGSKSTGGVGNASSGGARPMVAPAHPTDQVDLLLMIDNSISMGDKQGLLADAVPLLLERLATPLCVDASGASTGVSADSDGTCAEGNPEFRPVSDIHVGIITSSLGAHGGQTCATEGADDKGQLVPKVRAPDAMFPYQTWDDSGFLAWDPDSTRNTPPGEKDFASFAKSLSNMIKSVGQTGCGYEASLESWYRFLIDPDPPTSIPAVNDPSRTTTPIVPTDPEQNPVLVQRAAFLRPDSALVILMLSDENDCSIIDAGQGWLVAQQTLGGEAFHMPLSTSACQKNPNDPCCGSCASDLVASGCVKPAFDPACASPSTALEDNLNLRCWDQKRRFGFDLLYPLSRYVDGLTQLEVPRRNGGLAQNPLFPKGGRTPTMVFLSGIVGVPWQDLATKASLTGASLEYLNHAELTTQLRWPLMLGDEGDASGAPPTPPDDKLMFETTEDRSALFGAAGHPLLGTAAVLAPATSTARPNAINGHEIKIPDKSELQYACIFPLPQAKDCAAGVAPCDCTAADAPFNRPICDGTTQTHAKAYPSVRELRVLKAVGDITQNSVTASICPKTLENTGPSSGYAPAMAALLRGLGSVLVR